MSSPATAAPTGDMLVTLAATHLNERYVLGALVPKDNPNWKGPWDCAEFASWVYFQVTGRLYGCVNDHKNPAVADAHTGAWKTDAEDLGMIVSIEDAARTPGAFVLRFPSGGIGHIVISDGKGGTVEAHSAADGVRRLTLANRRWDMGILPPGISYKQSVSPIATPPAPTIVYRLTNPLMTGPAIKTIQQALAAKGFDPGSPDGQFGPHTAAAVRAFQISVGLTPDAEVGPVTAHSLGVTLT